MKQTLPPGRGTILLLAAIAALGSLATQLLVPVLPLLAASLHSNAADAQLVISAYLIALGAGQLVAGPLADRWGRKPVLLAGLAVYCFGSIMAAFAPSLAVLLAARVVQALGGAAGVVLARVLVSDLFPATEAARRQATLMAVILLSPALAPVAGGAIGEWTGWRAIFVTLAAAGSLVMVLAGLRLPRPARRGDDAARLSLLAALRSLSRNGRFVGAALAIAAGSSALYMFLGTAPFLLARDHGLSPRQIGEAMMLVALASIAGTFLVGRIEQGGDALLVGSALLLGSSGALLVLSLAGLGSLPAFLGPMLVLGLGAGMSGPAGIARILRSQPGLEGTTASLAGALQMLASAASAATLGRFAPVDALRLAAALVLASTIALFATQLNRNPRIWPMQGLA